MKTKWIIIPGLIIIVLCINACLNKVLIKNVHNFSDSRQESIKNGLFTADYLPTKKILKLHLRPVTVYLDSAWTEYAWTEVPKFFGSELQKTGGYWNLAVRVDTVTTEEFIYSLSLTSDSIGGIWSYNPITKQHEGKLRTFPDTLTVIVQEKSTVDSLGWKRPIVTDTIFYVKVKSNSR